MHISFLVMGIPIWLGPRDQDQNLKLQSPQGNQSSHLKQDIFNNAMCPNTGRLSNYNIIIMGMGFILANLRNMDVGIKVIFAPKSHEPLSSTHYPIFIWIVKLPESLKLVDSLFWILELHFLVSVIVVDSANLLLLATTSFKYLAYLRMPCNTSMKKN